MDGVVGEVRQEGEVGFLPRTAVGMHPAVVTEADTGRGAEDMRLTRCFFFSFFFLKKPRISSIV